jgi:hypothetical protein
MPKVISVNPNPKTLPERQFLILSRSARNTMPKIARRDRRSWAGIIDALTRGEDVFLPEFELTDDGKYLRTALSRRGKGEVLRTQVDRQLMSVDGGNPQFYDGRRLWIE